MSAPALELRTLGAAFARGPDGAGLNGLGAKGLAALVYLALAPGQAATRDVLVDLLWGRGAPEQGRASLRQELRRMKRALGELFDACLETPGGQIALRPGAVRCDYLEVEHACQARDTAGLSALLERYGGPFLAPLSVNEVAFQDWTAERNSHVETVALEGLLRLMLLDESAGRLDRAAQAARALLGIDPLQEDVHAALVRLHVAAGRLRQARRHVESAHALFLDELGEPPETDLAALIPAAASGARAEPAASRAPSDDAPGAPARPADPSDRPLVALEIAPIEAGSPDDPSLLGALRASVLEQFGALSFMRIQDAAALCALGADLLLERADYAAVVALEAPAEGEAGAARLSFARRGDGALSAHRRLSWPQGSEVAPAAGLGPALAGALAAA
ncbi:MAG: BTAD domain-containing putative transcriptional regulator, partial [Pseudomonadota bacterium]